MNTVRRRVAVFLVALLGAGGVLHTTGPAAAAPAPGTVLRHASVRLPDRLAALATAERIEYATTDVNGGIISATGLVLTPTGRKANKVVGWGHGTTGLADICAPSANYAVFWPEGQDAVAGLLGSGWTVAAPDYPGLGTPQRHPYLIGASEGRALIDSVKAARNLDPALSTRYVVDGYSQGGQAGLFAGELAPRYDGNFQLRGVVAIAPVSNVQILAPAIPAAPNRGYLVMALAGLATVDPTVDLMRLLASPAEEELPVLRDGCLNEILDAYAPITDPANFLEGGELPASVVRKLARWDNPGQLAPSAPILLVQGTADEAVPDFVTRDYLLPQLSRYGTATVEYKEYPGATHEGAVSQSVDFVDGWIATRFTG
jgi:alpha-beta hydrolase superfamily lysophospholipase